MVNPTLNLVDHLLSAATRCQEQGRLRDAVRLLTRLAGFRELPADAAEQAQARLAELQLKRRKYPRARRHLAAALQYAPDEARYHYHMATALVRDNDADLERAAEHYRRSLELDPKPVKCQSDYGLLQVRLGETEEGLTRLRQAVEQAPADADAVSKLAKGLRLSGRTEEASAALRAALFRNPRVLRFRKLWNEFQFQQLRQEQDQVRLRRVAARRRRDAVILPFVRPADRPTPLTGRGETEAEVVASLRAPAAELRGPRTDQRHVQ